MIKFLFSTLLQHNMRLRKKFCCISNCIVVCTVCMYAYLSSPHTHTLTHTPCHLHTYSRVGPHHTHCHHPQVHYQHLQPLHHPFHRKHSLDFLLPSPTPHPPLLPSATRRCVHVCIPYCQATQPWSHSHTTINHSSLIVLLNDKYILDYT